MDPLYLLPVATVLVLYGLAAVAFVISFRMDRERQERRMQLLEAPASVIAPVPAPRSGRDVVPGLS